MVPNVYDQLDPVSCYSQLKLSPQVSQHLSLRVGIATQVLSGYMTDCRELFEPVSFKLPVSEVQSYATTVGTSSCWESGRVVIRVSHGLSSQTGRRGLRFRLEDLGSSPGGMGTGSLQRGPRGRDMSWTRR